MPKLLTEQTTDFKRGQVDDTAGTRFPSDALALILNGRLLPDATVQRRPGSVRTHTTALNSGAIGFGATTFVTAAGAVQYIVFAGDTAYYSADYGASWSQIATGLRASYYDFATMRVGASNYLFAANGDSTIKSWDGTTWTTVSNAPSGVKHIAVFNGRLWATGHSGVLVQASKIADPDTWASPDGLTVQVLVSSGDVPTGLHQIGPHLLVFNDSSTSYIDGFGEQTIIVASGATGFSRSVGCVAFRSIASAGDDGCCWLSKRGVEYYTPGSDIRLLSRGITQYMDSIDREELLGNPGRPTGCYDEVLEEYRLAVSTSGTRNDMILRFSMRQRSQSFFGAPSIDKPISLTSDLFFGDDGAGYLTEDSGGYELKATGTGYVALASSGSGGDVTVEDGNNYLSTSTDDTQPATIFMAQTAEHPELVHSVGYDGFVRIHDNSDTDDKLKDGTGGATITMKLVSKPFFFGSIRHQKKVRVAHVAAISDAEASLSIGVRAQGALGTLENFTIPGTELTQAKRARIMISGKGDAPQLELHTTDDIRITLLGLSAIVRKERV